MLINRARQFILIIEASRRILISYAKVNLSFCLMMESIYTFKISDGVLVLEHTF